MSQWNNCQKSQENTCYGGEAAASVVRDAPVLATAADGEAVTRIICAIQESAAAGLPVAVG